MTFSGKKLRRLWAPKEGNKDGYKCSLEQITKKGEWIEQSPNFNTHFGLLFNKFVRNNFSFQFRVVLLVKMIILGALIGNFGNIDGIFQLCCLIAFSVVFSAILL